MLTERQELERLRVRVRELEEELAEWRRSDAGDYREEADQDRVQAVRDALKVMRGPARLLLGLVDAGGRIVSRARLDELSRFNHEREANSNLTAMYACRVRRSLADRGVCNVIDVVWGEGYRVTPENARRIKALWGEA